MTNQIFYRVFVFQFDTKKAIFSGKNRNDLDLLFNFNVIRISDSKV